jgi:polysaccharide chain length determinant protein (PEP-CTERM system associated)
MVRNGEITLPEARRIVRTYWWIFPIAVFGCGILGLLAAMVLPKRYTSQTMVLVDQPNARTEFVKPVDTEGLNRRLASMQEQILSRTRLEAIIEKLGLYAKDRGRVPIQELVEKLRTAVIVRPMESMPGTQNPQNHGLPGFHVNVTFDSPQIAQQICTEITSMFLNQNARERERQAASTTSFLSGQLREAKAKLDEQDAKLAQFKRQHLGSLPEEEQVNLNLLTAMNSQLQSNLQALSRAQQDKALNEALLSQQEANSEITAEQQLSLLQVQLTALRARYTPEHPDVVKLQNQIEDLKKRMADVPKTNEPEHGDARPSAGASPQVQQLLVKLRQDELNLADLTKRQNQVQEQIRELQGRLQASPVVAEQFREMTSNHQAALDFYNDLLKRQEQSAMATDLEHQQDSEQFRVLDPPSLANKPSFPKRSYFAGGGLGAGVVLALGIMYLIALTDKSMHTERDVEISLNLPVLTIVPSLELDGRALASPGRKQADWPLGVNQVEAFRGRR